MNDGHCFVWPRPEKAYFEKQDSSTQIDKNRDLALDYWAKIKSFLPKNKRFRFLEIGASRGSFSKLIAERLNADVEAIEMDQEAARYAKEKLGLKVYSGTFGEFEAGESFDVIFSGHVIEHVFDANEFLLKCRGLLSENGILIFISPNADSWKQFFLHDAWGWSAKEGHAQFFSVKSAKRIGEALGFRIQAYPTIAAARHYPLILPGVLLRFFPSLDSIRQDNSLVAKAQDKPRRSFKSLIKNTILISERYVLMMLDRVTRRPDELLVVAYKDRS